MHTNSEFSENTPLCSWQGLFAPWQYVLRSEDFKPPLSCVYATLCWSDTDFQQSTAPLTSLTEDEVMIQQTVQKFAREVIGPKVSEMDRNGVMCPEIIEKCFEQGFMGIEVSEDLGGAGTLFSWVETLGLQW